MIVSFGSLNADLIFNLDTVPAPGQTLLARSFRMEAGGKGANQAVAAARAGASVMMAGAVGNDALATVALQNLLDAGVETCHVAVDVLPTGCASIYVNGEGHNQIAVALGANQNAKASQVNDALLAKADILLLQLENDPLEVETLLRRAKANAVFCILNLAPAIRIDLEAMRLCDFLVVNEDEAEIAAGWLECDATAASLSAALGTGVVRTMGSRGAELVSGGIHQAVAAHAIVPVDTTAAGDCFIGTLAAGLDKGMDLRASLTRATAAAAVCCTRKGSQSSLPWKSDIDRCLRDGA